MALFARRDHVGAYRAGRIAAASGDRLRGQGGVTPARDPNLSGDLLTLERYAQHHAASAA